MRLKIILFIIIFLSCVNSCSNNKGLKFPETREIKAELIKINEIFNPNFLTMKGSYLLVASAEANPMIYTYSLPSLTFLKASVNKGRGPGEIPFFPMFCESPGSEMLYIWGYTPTSIGKNEIGVDGSLHFKEEILLGKYEEFNNMSIVDDSIFIYNNPTNLTVTKYDLKAENQPEYISLEKENHKEASFYSNNGYIVNNLTHLVYFYLYKKQLDFYDLNSFKLKRTIYWETNDPPIVIKDFTSLTYHYRNAYAGDNYLYALYGSSRKGNLRLEVFDYRGNPIREYILDEMITLFVIDEKKSILYGFNSEDAEHFVRYYL